MFISFAPPLKTLDSTGGLHVNPFPLSTPMAPFERTGTKANRDWWEMGTVHSSRGKTLTKSITLLPGLQRWFRQ